MVEVDRTGKTVTITTAQQRFASWTTDVLIYTIVLNLFVEHVDTVVIDSFTISLLTAVLLKLLLDVLEGVEHRVSHSLRERGLQILSCRPPVAYQEKRRPAGPRRNVPASKP